MALPVRGLGCTWKVWHGALYASLDAGADTLRFKWASSRVFACAALGPLGHLLNMHFDSKFARAALGPLRHLLSRHMGSKDRPRHAGSGRTVLFAAFRPRSVRAALQLCQAYGIRFHAIEVGAHVAHHKISQGGAVNTDSPPWER